MTTPAVLPFEYRVREIPAAVELCSRCRLGLIHRRGPAALPYCPKCGHEAPGHAYQLVREGTA